MRVRLVIFFFLAFITCIAQQPGSKGKGHPEADAYQKPENRLYTFSIDNHYGFKNYIGNIVIKPIYQQVRNFMGNYAAVMNNKFAWGMINKKGELVLPMKYCFLRSPTEGLICFAEKYNADGLPLIGYMDLKGNVKISPQYITGFEFLDGIVPVEAQDGKWGYIDKEGKVVVHFIFDEIIPFFEGGASVRIGSKWGEVDRKGKIIIEPK